MTGPGPGTLWTIDCGNSKTSIVAHPLPVVVGARQGRANANADAGVGVDMLRVRGPVDGDALDEALRNWTARLPAAVALSSVHDPSATAVEAWLAQHAPRAARATLRFGRSQPVPIKNRTRTPETVGDDRLLAALGCALRYPRQAVVVVDAGTAVTVDLLDAAGAFCGGTIAPGPSLMLQALAAYTSKLPTLDFDDDTAGGASVLGLDTPAAMRAGVSHGAEGLIRSLVTRLARCSSDRGEPVRVVLTGGTPHLAARAVAGLDIPCETLPGIVHDGLAAGWALAMADRRGGGGG